MSPAFGGIFALKGDSKFDLKFVQDIFDELRKYHPLLFMKAEVTPEMGKYF